MKCQIQIKAKQSVLVWQKKRSALIFRIKKTTKSNFQFSVTQTQPPTQTNIKMKNILYLMYREMGDELRRVMWSGGIRYFHAACQSLPWLVSIHPPLPALKNNTRQFCHIQTRHANPEEENCKVPTLVIGGKNTAYFYYTILELQFCLQAVR